MPGDAEGGPSRDDGSRRRAWRPLWLVAVVAVAVGVGALVRGLGDGGMAAGDASAPAPLDAAARWSRHPDPDAVASAAAAPDGDVWAGVMGGLVRWDADGDDHQRHTPEALSDHYVASVAVGDDGAVWAVGDPLTPSGASPHGTGTLVRLDDGEWITESPGGGDGPVSSVRSVTAGADGSVWVTGSGIASRYVDGEWHTHAPFGRNLVVEAITVGADGVVWATGSRDGTAGVARFADGTWTSWTAGEELPDGRTASLATGPDGGAWLALHAVPRLRAAEPIPSEPTGYRLLRFDDEGGAWTTVARAGRDLPRGWFTALAVGPDATPWLSVLEPGTGVTGPSAPDSVVARLDGGSVTTWTTADGLPRGRLGELAVDADGAVWAAAGDAPGSGARPTSVARFADGTWTAFDHADGLPAAPVRQLVHADGGPWAVSGQGLARFDGDGWTPAVVDQGPAGPSITAVAARAGTVWTGGSGGVSRFDGRAWTTWTDEGSRPPEALRAATELAVSADGTLWAATGRGVARFDGDGWTTWDSDDGLASDHVRSIAAGDDAVWAGIAVPSTQSGGPQAGLARFDGDGWTTWTGHGALADRIPVDVAVGAGGHVWLALPPVGSGPVPAAEGRLARFDGQDWEVFSADDGLPSNHVQAVATQPSGTVWVGTDQGVARFDGQRWVSADTEDNPLGLGDEPAATDQVTALATGPDGTVWVATAGEHTLGGQEPGGPPSALSRFDGRQWTGVTADDAPISGVHALAVGEDAVWVADWTSLLSFDR